MPDADDLKQEAEKRITLSKGELWLLRIAAATGAVSMLSHGAVVVGWVLDKL